MRCCWCGLGRAWRGAWGESCCRKHRSNHARRLQRSGCAVAFAVHCSGQCAVHGPGFTCFRLQEPRVTQPDGNEYTGKPACPHPGLSPCPHQCHRNKHDITQLHMRSGVQAMQVCKACTHGRQACRLYKGTKGYQEQTQHSQQSYTGRTIKQVTCAVASRTTGAGSQTCGHT